LYDEDGPTALTDESFNLWYLLIFCQGTTTRIQRIDLSSSRQAATFYDQSN